MSDAEARDRLADLVRTVVRTGHSAALGIAFHDIGADWIELTLPYNETLVGDPATGVLASGPIISLMDSAAGMAVWARMGRLMGSATIDLRIDYMRPARPGRTLIGRGECYHVTREVAFVRGTAHDGDPADPVANISGSFILMEFAPR